MTDPFKPEDYTLADDMFLQAVVDNLGHEDNVAEVKSAFYADAGRAFKDGKFVTTVERLIADHLWFRVNNKAQGATRRVLRELDSGQIAIPVDEWLDQVVTVGKHRRSTVRHLRRVDMLRMRQARQENVDKANAMLDFVVRVDKKLEPIWSQAGDLGEAYEKHLFTLHFVAPVADEADEASA